MSQKKTLKNPSVRKGEKTGNRNKCMDSLLEICLKAQKKLWLRKCDLKTPSESLLCSGHKQAIRMNYVKYHINKSVDSPSCRDSHIVICWQSYWSYREWILKTSPEGIQKKAWQFARMVHWNCVKNAILKSLKNGIYTIFKLLVRRLTTS